MVRYLVVDDELPTLVGLQRLLTQDGHDVRCLTDGGEALGALSTAPFDVVLTNLDLRVVDGHQVVRAARRHHPHACVFVTTVRAGLVVVEDACHILGKPIEYEAITRAVGSCRARGGPGQHGKCYMKTAAPDG